MTKDRKESEKPVVLPEGDALLLAAYLDGRLSEAAAARLEARLAGEAALLDELPALRRSLAAAPEAVPASEEARIVARAQALVPEVRREARRQAPRPRPVAQAQGSWIGGLLASWLQPAMPAFVALALLLAGVSAFELGQLQAAQQDGSQSAELGSDVPADLLWSGLL